MSSDPELWSIRFSPWSLRVKWSLKLLEFPYKTVEYIPPFGEWQLRLKLWQWRVTVPVLFASDVTLKDGKDIVKYAQDRKGAGCKDIWTDPVDEWINTADEIMGMMRHKSFMANLGDDELLKKAMPGDLKWMGPIGVMIFRNAMTSMAAKYPTPYSAEAVDAAFDRIRAAIQSSSTDYILGEFSYADVCVATIFQTIRPMSDDVLPLPDGIRPFFQQDDVASRCEDLLEWRDKMVSKHWAI